MPKFWDLVVIQLFADCNASLSGEVDSKCLTELLVWSRNECVEGSTGHSGEITCPT